MHNDFPSMIGQTYHLLGDAAYPVREYLLTPFKNYGTMNAKKELYNKKHCQTRVKIENAFGLLKQRFRQLIRLDFFSVERMCKFVLACCVLHNMCNDQCDEFHFSLDINTLQAEPNVIATLPAVEATNNELRLAGVAKRARILETL